MNNSFLKYSMEVLIMENKFLGVGLQKALGIAVFTMIVIICFKIIFTKYEIEGISEVVRTV